MRIKTILALAIYLCLGSGCKKSEPDPVFIGSDEPALQINGSYRIKYSPATFQIGYSPDNRQFRIHNDTMSEFYILTCSELPERQGQDIKCALKYAASGSISYKNGLNFRVERTDPATGMIWLWCSKKNIGVSVRKLR